MLRRIVLCIVIIVIISGCSNQITDVYDDEQLNVMSSKVEIETCANRAGESKNKQANYELNLDEENEFLYPACIDGKYGYINGVGEVVIPFIFDNAFHFYDNIAVVKLGDLYGCINKSGEYVLEPEYISIGEFSDGLAPIGLDYEKFGYINTSGEVVIEADYMYAKRFSEGLAPVMVDGLLWGYINNKGEIVIQPQFSECLKFSNGVAAVIISPYSYSGGYINKDGEILISYHRLQGDTVTFSGATFNEQVTFIRYSDDGNLKWTLMNFKGELIGDSLYDRYKNYSDGVAVVLDGESWGVINLEGEYVIEPKYDELKSFVDDRAGFRDNEKYGYINKKGEVVIEPVYDYVSEFYEGLATVMIDIHSAVIDIDGKYIWKSPGFND